MLWQKIWRNVSLFFVLIGLIISSINPVEASDGGRVEVLSKAAILIDENSGRVLYQKSADLRMSPASLTKIMTALLVIEDGDLDKRVRVSERAAETGESSIWLEAGEVLTRRELLYALMLSSANDAAVALAESVAGDEEDFVAMMNRRARELGLKNTHFSNPHGLEAAGHYTTARDLAFLTRYAMTNPVFSEIVATKAAVIPWEGHPWKRQLFNKNRLLFRYEGAIGVKTGYTKRAGNCLVGAARRGNLSLIVVVLNSPQVYEDAEKLLDYGFLHFQGYPLKVKKDLLQVDVCGGSSRRVALRPENDIVVAVALSEKKRLSYSIFLPKAVRAPVKRGEVIGSLRILLKGEEVGRINLLASSDVEAKTTFWMRLLAAVKFLFHKLCGVLFG